MSTQKFILTRKIIQLVSNTNCKPTLAPTCNKREESTFTFLHASLQFPRAMLFVSVGQGDLLGHPVLAEWPGGDSGTVSLVT